MIEPTKICRECGEEKLYGELKKIRHTADTLCKECSRDLEKIRGKKYAKLHDESFYEKAVKEKLVLFCTTCKKKKMPTEFSFSPTRLRGFFHSCRECVRDYWFRSNYNGLTTKDVEGMFKEQKGKCWICGVKMILGGTNGTSAVVDHDHKNGKTRKLICNHCNRLMGGARDDIRILQNAIVYLSMYKEIYYEDSRKEVVL